MTRFEEGTEFGRHANRAPSVLIRVFFFRTLGGGIGNYKVDHTLDQIARRRTRRLRRDTVFSAVGSSYFGSQG